MAFQAHISVKGTKQGQFTAPAHKIAVSSIQWGQQGGGTTLTITKPTSAADSQFVSALVSGEPVDVEIHDFTITPQTLTDGTVTRVHRPKHSGTSDTSEMTQVAFTFRSITVGTPKKKNFNDSWNSGG